MAYYWGNTVFDGMNWNPHTQQVNLFINDEYLGVYLLVERIKINEATIDINEISQSNPTGDWIVEVNARLDETYNWTTTHGIPISLKDPDDYEGYESIKNAINEIEEVLYGNDWLDPSTGWRAYLNEDSFVDWYLANEIAKNNDAGWYLSVFLYKDSTSDGKIQMGPLWDFDIGFGNINYNSCDDASGWWIKDSGWHKRLFEDPTFVANVKTRWNSIKSKLDVENTISAIAFKLVDDSTLNFQKWDILGKYVWPNSAGFEKRTTYFDEVNYLIEWLKARIEWLDTNINAL